MDKLLKYKNEAQQDH